MSGIFGLLKTRGGPVSQKRLQSLSQGLGHRGPDGARLYRDHNFGCGHRMLGTTPEAADEILPACDPASGLVLTSDARLDNRDELIGLLGRRNFGREIISDSQILLLAYRRWHTRCVDYLRGDFAFAVWDPKEQLLFCARDHLGVKPFYYFFQDGLFLFSSEAQNIAHQGGVDAPINEARIADHLTPHLEGIDKVSTFYTSISRLPPAHSVTIHRGQQHVHHYWQPQAAAAGKQRSNDEYREELTEILRRSVAARCRGLAQPALLLSGGIDSATIMGIAEDLSKKGEIALLHTFSGVSANLASCKESRLIRLLARQSGTHSHLFSPADLTRLAEPLWELLTKIQEPFDICMVLAFLLYHQASSKGCRAVLDGVDGDMLASLSSGYPAALLRQGALATALQESRCQSRRYPGGWFSWQRQFGRYLLSVCIPQFFKDIFWHLRRPAKINKMVRESKINPAFARRVHFSDRLVQFAEQGRGKTRTFPHGEYLHNVQHPFLTVGLERYDRVAALCSVEPRHPLVTRELVDFYCRVPWHQFVADGWSKVLLRRVGQHYLPQEVCWRRGKEHVGGQYLLSLLQHQQTSLVEKMKTNQQLLHKFLQSGIAHDALKSYSVSEMSEDVDVFINSAGLALWIEKERT